jgi:SAM-dependent methyltransferase
VLTYYSAAAHRDFWTEHWGGHSVDELLAVARASPLTDLITQALPPAGVVLEAGCGLGQYVILLRERGWRAAGVDGSSEALVACRRAAAVPLAASDLRALAIRSGALAAYVSLGVVEHDPDGPDAILAEAHRVLAPDGILAISVPYLNGVRRLAAPWIRRRQTAIRQQGGAFYQYAFTREEFLTALRRQRFEPLTAVPYDPARVLRGVLRRARRTVRAPSPRARAGHRRAPTVTAGVGAGDGDPSERTRPRGASEGSPSPAPTPAPRAWITRFARKALYTEPALRLLGHMLLVIARRA